MAVYIHSRVLENCRETLEIQISMCYTQHRCKAHKNKVLQGFRRFPALNESSVRDLPLVKQN